MSNSAVSQTALALPMADRVELLDRLFDSINAELKAREDRWAKESEERIDAVGRGEMPTLDGPRSLADLRRSLHR